MPKISRKRPRDGQEVSRSSAQASTGTVIPGYLRVEEPLPRTQFFCYWWPTGARKTSRERKKPSYTEYLASQHSNQQHNICSYRAREFQRRPNCLDHTDRITVDIVVLRQSANRQSRS